MKFSKDFRLISIILVVELLFLSILFIIASVRFGGGSSGNISGSAVSGNNIGRTLFSPTGRMNLGGKTMTVTPAPVSTGAPASPSALPTAAPTSEPEKFNYYTFDFSESGYRTNRIVADEGGAPSSGMTLTGVTAGDLTVKQSKSEFYLGNISIENHYVGKELPLTEIFASPLKLPKLTGSKNNQFVVFYTHTYEGYCLTEEEQLVEKRWYTSDNNESNVVAAGTAFHNRLTSLGIPGVNNTKVHNDGADALKSYELSYETLKTEIGANPETKLVLDVHRNGYGSLYKGKLYGPTAELNGEKYAKIMFVIGLDYSSERGEYSYETNPYWKENFKLVFLLLEKLEEKCPGITYGIALRRTPYNQNLSPNSLLAEIGFEGNLASEAARTAGLLAETVAEVYS